MQNQKLNDSVLVSNYINGNERSLEILVNRHKQRIYSFIYSKVLDRDVTEDIFQDTFIKVIKTLKRGSYSEEGKFLPWVMRIAHNLVIDHFRRNKRRFKLIFIKINFDYCKGSENVYQLLIKLLTVGKGNVLNNSQS